MHGPLSEIGLADVLQLLERGRRSGLLRVIGPDPTSPRTMRLRLGRITSLEPDASDAAVINGLAERSLLPAGPMTDDEPVVVAVAIRDALRRRLATRALTGMLHWTRGRFDFEEHVVDPGPLSLSADMLVIDVVDAEERRAMLAAAMSDFHAVPDLTSPDTIARGTGFEPGVLDWRILDAIDGMRDVRAIATQLSEPLEDVAGRIQGLVAAAIIVLRQPLADAARAALDTGRFDDAADLLRARVADVPDDGHAWRALGLAEAAAGRFDRAVDAWTAWQGIDPDHLDDAATLINAARTISDALREP